MFGIGRIEFVVIGLIVAALFWWRLPDVMHSLERGMAAAGYSRRARHRADAHPKRLRFTVWQYYLLLLAVAIALLYTWCARLGD